MAAKLGNITFDCDDVLKVASFWSAALGRPLDAGSSQWFASIGGADAERHEPAWYFDKVPELKQAKNRCHPDVVDPDPEAVGKLVELGATIVAEHKMRGHTWTTMQDPEGNEFCIATKSFIG